MTRRRNTYSIRSRSRRSGGHARLDRDAGAVTTAHLAYVASFQPAAHRGHLHRRASTIQRLSSRRLSPSAESKADLPIEWRPLLPKETTSQLTLQSAELGSYLYDLRLMALPRERPSLCSSSARSALSSHYATDSSTSCASRTRTSSLSPQRTARNQTSRSTPPSPRPRRRLQRRRRRRHHVRAVGPPSRGGDAHDLVSGGRRVHLRAARPRSCRRRPQGPIVIKSGASASCELQERLPEPGGVLVCDGLAGVHSRRPKETVRA